MTREDLAIARLKHKEQKRVQEKERIYDRRIDASSSGDDAKRKGE